MCDIPLDEVVHLDMIVSNPANGGAVDADAAPEFSIYEENNDTAIVGPITMTKRTALTGNYRGSFTANGANGFEVGKWYSVIGSATVGGVVGKGVLKNFRLVAVEMEISQASADKVWGTTVRRLSDGTNIVLAKGVGLTGLNDIPATAIVTNGAITTLAGAVVNVTNLTTAPPDSAGVGTLLTRVPANVALASELALVKAVTTKLDTMMVLDIAVYQFTANALELAPTGGGVPPSVVEIRQEMDTNSTKLQSISADTGNLLTAVNTNGVKLLMTAAVPTANGDNTVGDCLNGARAQAFGDWTLDEGAKTITLYKPDGSTPAFVFDIDDAVHPTTRTKHV